MTREEVEAKEEGEEVERRREDDLEDRASASIERECER